MGISHHSPSPGETKDSPQLHAAFLDENEISPALAGQARTSPNYIDGVHPYLSKNGGKKGLRQALQLGTKECPLHKVRMTF